MHPLVGRRMTELERAAGQDAVVVHELTDFGTELPGVAEARMAAQASREKRLAIADFVVDNSGSLAELDRQVGDLWTELRRRSRLRATQ